MFLRDFIKNHEISDYTDMDRIQKICVIFFKIRVIKAFLNTEEIK